jgi:hypothetical protein
LVEQLTLNQKMIFALFTVGRFLPSRSIALRCDVTSDHQNWRNGIGENFLLASRDDLGDKTESGAVTVRAKRSRAALLRA